MDKINLLIIQHMRYYSACVGWLWFIL